MRRRCHTRMYPRAHGAAPGLEGLEGRLLLYSTTGGAWTRPERITYSFMPDGTNIGGSPSALFSTLNPRFDVTTWTNQFRKAAAIWQHVANVNLVNVADNGSTLGASGNQQGDSRFGDIRIGGTVLGAGQLAAAFLPPPQNGGTAAGDILMNTAINWQINSDYNLLTVAIHEFGHSLGMDHSSISSAVMYAFYNATKQALTPDDTSGIRSIYEARAVDPFDYSADNQTRETATSITPYISGVGQVAISGVSITTSDDYDYYKVVVPATNSGSMVASVQSFGLSSLSPRVQVYNAAGDSLAATTQVGAYGATVSVTIAGIVPGQTYYVRASNANGGPTGTGAYGLLVNFGSQSQPAIPPPNTTVAEQQDQGGGALSDTSGAAEASADAHADGELRVGGFSGFGDGFEIPPVQASHAHAAPPRRTLDNPGASHSLHIAPTTPDAIHDAAIASLVGGGEGKAAGRRRLRAMTLSVR